MAKPISKCDTIFVEILQKKSNLLFEEIQNLAYQYLCSLPALSNSIRCENSNNKVVSEHIEEITISDISAFPVKFDDITFFVYTVSEHNAEIETLEDGNDNSDEVPASNHWILPNREFQSQWEHLIYEKGLKENIFQFAKTIMLFSQKKINANIISCNKLVLLHGPPGTGKTSLCKALAQKLSIHMHDKFSYTHLFEINSHSLFSKWFSESGKLVLKLFANIKEVAEHKDSLVIILIDEVESIAYARESISTNEPSDSLRVVNAVLTQLDQLRKYSNVLVLTTSNLTSTIDIAFIDRADLKQFIGEPSVEAIYEIYKSSIDELMNVNIISTKWSLLLYSQMISTCTHALKPNDVVENCSKLLWNIAQSSHGLSGRALRKLPLLAHAWFIDTDHVTLMEYLSALQNAVNKHLNDSKALHKISNSE